MEESWINVYDDLARQHKNPVAQSGYMDKGVPMDESLFDQWVSDMQSHFLIRPSDFVLDVGCGSGLFLKRFQKYSQNLFGVDTSSEQLKSAGVSCPIATLRVADALNAGFNGIEFDRVFCNSVFLYFNSLEYSKNVIKYFISISKSNAKIWIGDLPYPMQEMEYSGSNYRRKPMSKGIDVQHYPVEFMLKCCDELNVRGSKIEQNPGWKSNAALRYDLLIEKI